MIEGDAQTTCDVFLISFERRANVDGQRQLLEDHLAPLSFRTATLPGNNNCQEAAPLELIPLQRNCVKFISIMTKLAGDLAERRKHSRLPLSFGVIVRIRERTGWRELNGFSENLGSRGILFATDGQIKSGSKVEI